RAQALIREGGRTMAEISYAVGFNDPHYFSKVFKQESGMTPTEYRNSLKQEAG
ncbi:MAG: AraC family transcriptional regulator, partial [Bacteroidales bacterium]|nr:AraC family transcriptional regulator [Bacteroidales bacterium]